MRLAIVPATTVAVLLAAAGQAAAQAPACQGRACVEKKWNALHAHAVEVLQNDQTKRNEEDRKGNLAPQLLTATSVQSRDRATRQSSIIAEVDAVEADDSTAAATVRRLAGAIKTNPEGTEAGLVIAPFALAGWETLSGLEVTFAALKDDFTRLGGSYTKDASPKLKDIWDGVKACPIEPRIKKLDEPRDFYFNACTNVVADLPEELGASSGASEEERARFKERIHRGRLACGLADAGGSTDVNDLAAAIAVLRQLVTTTNELAARTGAIAGHVAVYALSLAPTVPKEGWGPALATSCYTDEFIRGYFKQLYWEHGTWKLAGSISFDLFARHWGFNPKPETKLSNGEVKSEEVRFDFAGTRKAWEYSAGFGYGRSREVLKDPLRGYFAPSFSIAHAFTLMQALTTNGALNVTEDGEMPPRWVVGVSTALQIAKDKPESQKTNWNSVKIQPHVDFLINDTLSFRLGVPFTSEIKVKEKQDAQPETPTSPAKPEVPEERALQKSLPFAIIAVLKL